MTTEQKLREALQVALPYIQDGADAGDEALNILPIVQSALSLPTQAEPVEGGEVVSYEVWWGLGEMRPMSRKFATPDEALAAAREIKSKTEVRPVYATPPASQEQAPAYTYVSTQSTMCASCGEHKHTPLRIDAMGGYVCLTCIDKKLGSLLGEFGYPQPAPASAELPPYIYGREAGENEKVWTEQAVRAALSAQAVPDERDKVDAERWRYAMDWDTKGFAVCMRVGKTGQCWEPIKTDGPIDAAIAARAAAKGDV